LGSSKRAFNLNGQIVAVFAVEPLTGQFDVVLSVSVLSRSNQVRVEVN
jgi:hypothetical protein